MSSEVLINGAPSDGKIPVTDSSVLRGDGCFEVLRIYQGRPFAVEEHLARLERSAAALAIPLPPSTEIATWVEKVSSGSGNGAVRIVATRGSSVPGADDPARVIVFAHPLEDKRTPAHLFPVAAPWHSAGFDWDLAAAKVLSYAPNMAATRRARLAGFEDALLHTPDGVILEGSTFAIGWVVDGVLETPGLELGILESITRKLVLQLATQRGLPLVEGRWTLDRLDHASEVTVWSTVREVQSVVSIGDRRWEPGPITQRLHQAFMELIENH